MTIVEKMKKAESKEKALEELGKDLQDRLSNFGNEYGEVTGAFIGTFLSITDRLITGEFDEKRYEEWKEGVKSTYRNNVLKKMKGFEEYIDELSKEILAEQTNLRSLKKSAQPNYVR